MSYRDEFPDQFFVPQKIDKLVKKGVLKDESWGNDIYPSFRLVHEPHLVLWIAPAMKQHREHSSDTRFSLRNDVLGGDPEDITVVFQTEDLGKMLRYILVTER